MKVVELGLYRIVTYFKHLLIRQLLDQGWTFVSSFNCFPVAYASDVLDINSLKMLEFYSQG